MRDITTLVAAISTASGYVSFWTSYYCRYRMYNQSWEQRLFESTLLGGALFSISRFISVSIIKVFPNISDFFITYFYKEALPFAFSRTILLTVFLSIAFGIVSNIFISKIDASIKVNKRFGNALRVKIIDSMFSLEPFMLRTESGRILVGFITRPPGFESEKKYVSIMPLFAGFENSKGVAVLTVNFCTEYWKILNSEEDDIDLSKFDNAEIVVDLESVVYGRIFDMFNMELDSDVKFEQEA